MGPALGLDFTLSSMIAIWYCGKHVKLQKTIDECWCHFGVRARYRRSGYLSETPYTFFNRDFPVFYCQDECCCGVGCHHIVGPYPKLCRATAFLRTSFNFIVVLMLLCDLGCFRCEHCSWLESFKDKIKNVYLIRKTV